MKRGLAIAAGGAAILIAGLTGCSHEKSSSGSSGATGGATATASVATSLPNGGNAAAGSGTAKVTVDGQPQDVAGSIGCTTSGGNVVIGIGNASGGLGATLTDADPPVVKAVGLGNVGGTALAYAEGVPGNEATATRDGKTYKITGTISAVDMSNPTAGPAKKSFEMEVTCP
ncbi:lipoprotein LpqH [Mycobacterium sp. OTB74]|jgi:lipoprotein LpqH|uniref:lipoprotein LpqH n=1 Tax=Mycobacterium sp. OTB74 TaxID=1853452 RepID=UPI002474BD36|nr:lipoprotein LpqH [Mycobacterium sp. OTB74]MDH6243528.1 lipoprotein LpqH [Mycobacterium sp. OTB74]